MIPSLISDAKDKHPTFIFTVIRSRVLSVFRTEIKLKHGSAFSHVEIRKCTKSIVCHAETNDTVSHFRR